MADAAQRRPGSWNRASLVIHSETLTPAEISEALDTKPDQSGLKGESIGRRAPKTRKASYWALDSALADDIRIEDQIGKLLDFVDEHVDALVRLIKSGSVDVRIQAAISDDGGQYPMTFDARTLQRLATVPLTLWLTAWMPGSKEDEAL